jgi:hypothetical protein
MMSKPQIAHCKHCRSTDVTHDALARWSIESLEWELCSTLDNSDRDQCGEFDCVELRDATAEELNLPHAAHRDVTDLHSPLRRVEALGLIGACHQIEEAKRLYEHWIGHRELRDHTTLDEVKQLLTDYVAECTCDDEVRRFGPSDEDDTGLTSLPNEFESSGAVPF